MLVRFFKKLVSLTTLIGAYLLTINFGHIQMGLHPAVEMALTTIIIFLSIWLLWVGFTRFTKYAFAFCSAAAAPFIIYPELQALDIIAPSITMSANFALSVFALVSLLVLLVWWLVAHSSPRHLVSAWIGWRALKNSKRQTKPVKLKDVRFNYRFKPEPLTHHIGELPPHLAKLINDAPICLDDAVSEPKIT